jgi:hypothetical protein
VRLRVWIDVLPCKFLQIEAKGHPFIASSQIPFYYPTEQPIVRYGIRLTLYSLFAESSLPSLACCHPVNRVSSALASFDIASRSFSSYLLVHEMHEPSSWSSDSS